MARVRSAARCIAAACPVSVLLLSGAVPYSSPGPDAVLTSGSGTLTICRDWFVYNSCETYHHVALPPRVAVGDSVDLVFGSNTKQYTFHVTHIQEYSGHCTLLSDRSGAGEKVEVTDCRPLAKPAARR